MKAIGSVDVSYNIPSTLEPLVRLAMNLRWSWHRPARELFEEVDPGLWAETGNPRELLRRCRHSRLVELSEDADFMARVRAQAEDLSEYLSGDRWFQTTHAEHQVSDRDTFGATNRTPTDPIAAYFSMEYGIDPSLPIYSGGLGVLAGDHLKSASDLGVPLIAVGLLYTYGYFTQTLTADGRQEEKYVERDPRTLPVEKLRDDSGAQLVIEVDFPENRTVSVALWVAQVGRVPLLLLDTDIDSNPQDLREITDRLYGGDDEHRIRQEIILGVGGVRAVNAFCDTRALMRPRVAHLNEGHAGFLGLELIRERMEKGFTYEEALHIVRAGNVFTTHTPVAAGIDRFDMEMVRRHLDPDENGVSRLCPGVPVDAALDLGRESDPGRFNMAHMGLRLSQRSNGVSKLHGKVSREMFRPLFEGYDADEVPIGSVTNGVHLPTWAHPRMEPIIAAACGGDDAGSAYGAEGADTAETWANGDDVADAELWEARNGMRADLVHSARRTLRESWRERGADDAQLAWTDRLLDPGVLTVGFARRVSTYKRLTLMLRDPDRLRRLLLDPERPMQFVIAGKAHPRDMGGKQLMQEIIRFADEAGVRDRFVFLPDYGIGLAKHLVSGCDVWLNNPVRPLEASGTSGMKAVMNGAMTLSVSDGWWDEMPHDVGWTIPTVDSYDEGVRDGREAEALYDLLEHEIAPLFYSRADDGLPRGWLARVRASLTTLGPKVTSARMVRDYVDDLYRPADHAYRLISSDEDTARQYVNWKAFIRQGWPNIRLSQATCDDVPAGEGARILAGRDLRICVDVELGTLTDDAVRVQAVVGEPGADGEIVNPLIHEMRHVGEGRYSATVPTDRPGTYAYTVRVIPHHLLLSHPAQTGLVTYL